MSDKIQLFGRSYTQLGDSTSDIVLKTKGQVKIQWAGKFIDLIKDGKINVDASFLFKTKQIGSKDGIYVLEDGTVWVQMAGTPIPIVSNEVGTTYVSFLEQTTDSEAKHQALVNIGFLYPDIETFNNNGLQDGIIYIESEEKLYIVKSGELSEFKMSLPNPFTKQFIIAKTDTTKGAIYIQGKGIENSLAFDTLTIYTDRQYSTLESSQAICFRLRNQDSLIIDTNKLLSQIPIQSNNISSINADANTGFRLYTNRGKSILEVDEIIVRSDPSQQSFLPEYWFLNNNIISGIDTETDILITLKSANTYQVGDILGCYTQLEDENSETLVELEVQEIIGEQIKVSSIVTLENYQKLLGSYIFLLKREGQLPLRLKDNNLDIVEYTELENGKRNSIIHSRVGDLSSLENISGYGIYSDNLVVTNGSYFKTEDLPNEDNSTKFATTEWVRNLFKEFLPIGSIIAFHGTTIPNGWFICDGTNGTPDLQGKFIKGGTIEEEGGSEEIILNTLDIVKVDQTDTSNTVTIIEGPQTPIKLEPKYYQLVFIMKGS